eukprot:2832749-Rhodomonas_salina.1
MVPRVQLRLRNSPGELPHLALLLLDMMHVSLLLELSSCGACDACDCYGSFWIQRPFVQFGSRKPTRVVKRRVHWNGSRPRDRAAKSRDSKARD